MIYFDNSATSLLKPPEVAEAVNYALNHFGNSGRSFYDAVMEANRAIYQTREEMAKLVGLDDPLQVAFTSSATESLNLVIQGLINENDAVVTTRNEHNSVLRPLYLTGCQLDFLENDEHGNIVPESLDKMLRNNTRFLVCTHGSNLTGNITDLKSLSERCHAHDIIIILDVSQTLGSISVDLDCADVICFTGHKGLYGPQGTGGMIVANKSLDFNIVKTGGAGVSSFAPFQDKNVPNVFETGTPNSHGIYGLQKGVQFVNSLGIDAIHRKETKLHDMFYTGAKEIEEIEFYGDFSGKDRLPIVSLNIAGISSAELASKLWESFGIATRAGSHCAPLVHKHFKTEAMGMVRFSFSYFNSEEEIKQGIEALKTIAHSVG